MPASALVAAISIVGVALVACSVPAGFTAAPRSCADTFPAVRCANMAHDAASRLVVRPDEIVDIPPSRRPGDVRAEAQSPERSAVGHARPDGVG